MGNKFVLVDGYVYITNDTVTLEGESYSLKKDAKRYGIVGAVTFLLTYHMIMDLLEENALRHIKDYISKGLQFLGITFLIFAVLYAIFKLKWGNSIVINEIKELKIDTSDEFAVDVEIVNNRNRVKSISFRKLENQLEPFIEELKKKNSRINIRYEQ